MAESIVNSSLERLYEQDSFLLEKNVHERSIVHKFAEYLQQELDIDRDDIVVDCEYNRQDRKDSGIHPKEGYDGNRVFPDVVIHERGSNTNNLLSIEVKKNNNSRNRESDKQRLQDFTDKEGLFRYDQGLYLSIPVGSNWRENKSNLTWYSDGSERSTYSY